MTGWPTTARIVLTTAGSLEEARKLGRTLVEQRLAACATLAPAVESIYLWKGEIESASEVLLILKTEADQVDRLEKRLHELHSYETPEFLVLPVIAGSPAYLDWLHASLQEP
jgi:periplasmic divalent cation tolerance protein